jgi:DNA-binding XRE family transcriptional regulator
MLPVHNRGEDEIMTNDEIVERAKRLYTIIVNRELGDDEDSVCKRVCIVRELEAITHKDFRNTAEFHREVSAFLVRKSRIKETDGGRLRRARKRAKRTIEALAAELGVTERTVIRWEKNDGPPLSTRAVEWLNRQNISTGEKVTLVSERV